MANPLMDGHSLVLDDVLAKFKVHGRYHVVTIMVLTIGLMFEFIWYTNHVIVAGKIEYRCNKFSSKLKNLSSSSNIIVCKNPELCSEWIYDNPDSFVGEFQLACQEWKRTSVGSVHCFGYMLGLLTVGPLSDRFGRKTLVIMTGVAGGTLGIAKSFARSYWHYVTFEFLEAAIGDPISPIYTLGKKVCKILYLIKSYDNYPIEMVASKSRATYTTICMTGAGLGGILFALAAWMIPYWRTLLRVVYAPGLLAIFFIYLLDESPRWLLANGKKDKAVEIITRAAKLNNMEKEEHLNIISYEKNKGPSFATVIRDTFKSSSLLKRFFVCSVWWIAGTFVYFGLIVNSTFLQGNKNLNFGLTATMKCVGNFCAGNIINKFNRKVPLIVCFVACAILCAGQPFLPKSYGRALSFDRIQYDVYFSDLLWLQITNYMVGFLLSCTSFCIIYIFTSELFPTQSRNSMHALCSAVGRIGSMISPQTPLLMAYWSGLPTLTFGVVSLTAGLVTLFVPDTTDQSLPDTVRQAEKMETKILTNRSRLNMDEKSMQTF
ncbi:solute carrier family 22 member 1-like [Cydia pomonella]|uniref:solute carrier family 22 member 1-like n=1 Tax=Cydia pomonella TaxID=82600 RepID=UPI002ADDAE6E|nr:solute carrier family 22 member 1-like [Cydia pomonella]